MLSQLHLALANTPLQPSRHTGKLSDMATTSNEMSPCFNFKLPVELQLLIHEHMEHIVIFRPGLAETKWWMSHEQDRKSHNQCRLEGIHIQGAPMFGLVPVCSLIRDNCMCVCNLSAEFILS